VITKLVAAKDIQVARFTLPNDIKQGIQVAKHFSNQTDIIISQVEETTRISMEFLNAM